MKRFAQLLDRLSYEPARNGKLRLIVDYLRETGDPDRGFALAALTGALSFKHAKPALIRSLIAERADSVLFALSYDYVGDLSETVALMWPAAPGKRPNRTPPLSEIVDTLSSLGKSELPARLAHWLDALDETGRWALLKLVTGGLRVGVSARLAKTALATLGGKETNDIEAIWPASAPPYTEIFDWLEGRADKPDVRPSTTFSSPMLAHAIEEGELAALDPKDFIAEWKWDGIRVQAIAARGEDGALRTRLFSRTGDEITGSFPDLADALTAEAAIDGELLVVREGRVQSFNVLQQRLNRKTASAKLLAEFPAHLRAYDLLAEGDDDLRALPFSERRKRLEGMIRKLKSPKVDLSPVVPFKTWDALIAARADPARHGGGADAEAIEGVMLKRRDSVYVAGRPKGPWWKWKRDPMTVDAVLMYAQRGHGKRSSFYSDYTFGVWAEGENGPALVPVGKAYFGFTDDELKEIDRFIRRNTVDRFGPVRQVTAEADKGLVLEVAFEGLQTSTRHKSGLAMRFPRISRLRWDKPPREADRLETLEKMLADNGNRRSAGRRDKTAARAEGQDNG
jgi:DNA ligase-1